MPQPNFADGGWPTGRDSYFVWEPDVKLVRVPVDPTCAFHGLKWSEHEGGRCFHCPLCFRSDLGYPKYVDEEGQMWDVCAECGEIEALATSEEGSLGLS